MRTEGSVGLTNGLQVYVVTFSRNHCKTVCTCDALKHFSHCADFSNCTKLCGPHVSTEVSIYPGEKAKV